MNAPVAIVAGAGIGGLTAAVALHRLGWDVAVYERAAALEPVGAGISLAPNALRALDALGLGDKARALAVVQGGGGIRRPDGRRLLRTDLGTVAERFGDPIVIAHRAELIAILEAALPAGAIRTGAVVDGVEPGGGARPARVTVDDTDIPADLVVAADGVRSLIRSVLFPCHPGPEYAGFTTWRAVLPEPRSPYTPGESWGRGAVFGIMPLSGGRVYCYASANAPEGVTHPDERAALLGLFGGWHAPIPELLASAEPGAVLHNDVHWLPDPPPAYHAGRVALLGDAAHPMTPNLGQGGCQAIEDAVVLAHQVGGRGRDVPAALAAYTAERRPRTADIARRSRAAGRVQEWSSPAAVGLRNLGVRLASRLGPGVMLRQLAPALGWNPPQAGA